ncbi:MAG TPA: FAD-binding protein [Chloroflexi bacterium]|nr:FAD-binding protein [Chloroflexota bacterium]
MLNSNDIDILTGIVGEKNLSVRSSDLEAHSIDESHVPAHPPDVVVWPSSTEQVAAIVRHANERNIPVVAWSGGSSLEGNPVPVQGGILLAMYRMKEILEVREDDLQVVVQPGIVYDDLNGQLKRLGLFFPPAPGSSDVATIGGMVANNSSGMRAVKYGVTRDYVKRLKVVLSDGRMIEVGSNTNKSTSGYDLVSLFVGSEGTLGIITEVTLRLAGLPEKIAAVLAVFDSLEDAAGAVYESIRYGLDPSAIELLDAATVHVTNIQHGLSLRETPTLFVEFHGNEGGVTEQIDYVREICEDNGCVEFQAAIDDEERETLWTARREARDSIKLSHPGRAMISGDVCVPVSRFREVISFVHKLAEEMNLTIYTFGHAGDGNLHTETIVTREDEEEFTRGLAAMDEIVKYSLSIGGTIAGEHGVGRAKRAFMAQEHGESLQVMRQIKDLLDPKGILNPGKIFPDD